MVGGRAIERVVQEPSIMTNTLIRVAAATALGCILALPAHAQSAAPGKPPATAPAMTPAPAMNPAPATAMSPAPSMAPAMKAPSAGKMAASERRKTCSAEWKTAKAGTIEPGMKWPKFWSECNARLKGKSV
jgi:hypothetical protein